MDDGNLIKLRNSIHILLTVALEKLKHERDQLNDHYLREKENFVGFETEVEELQMQEEELQMGIEEKTESIREIDQMIKESENAYSQVKKGLTLAFEQFFQTVTGT